MNRTFCAFLILGLAYTAGHSQGRYDDPRDLEFIRLSNDIHVAFRPEPLRYWVEGNVTIILNEDDVVVVDGSGSNRSARQVIDHIRSVTDNPVTILINTHGHGDHTVGNSEYVRQFPGIEIIARPETYEYLTGKGIGYVSQIAESTESRKEAGRAEIARLVAANAPGADKVVANLRQYYEHDINIRQDAYREAVIAPPTVTIEDGVTLHRSNRSIQVMYLGPGDTHGDLIVFLPEDRVVVTGDMVVHPFPYGFSRHAPDWLRTLGELEALDFDALIPGHGQIQRGKAYLARVKELLAYVQAEVKDAIAQGLTGEQTIERVDLSVFKDDFAGDDPVTRYYFDEYFARPNVERTYLSLVDGREPSVE